MRTSTNISQSSSGKRSTLNVYFIFFNIFFFCRWILQCTISIVCYTRIIMNIMFCSACCALCCVSVWMRFRSAVYFNFEYLHFECHTLIFAHIHTQGVFALSSGVPSRTTKRALWAGVHYAMHMCEIWINIAPLNMNAQNLWIFIPSIYFTVWGIVFGLTSPECNNFLSAVPLNSSILFQLLRSTAYAASCCVHRFTVSFIQKSYLHLNEFIVFVADKCCFWLKLKYLLVTLFEAIVGYLPKCNFQFNGIFIRCRKIYYCECCGKASRCTPRRTSRKLFHKASVQHPCTPSNNIKSLGTIKNVGKIGSQAFHKMSPFSIGFYSISFNVSVSLHIFFPISFSCVKCNAPHVVDNLNINSIFVFVFVKRCCNSASICFWIEHLNGAKMWMANENVNWTLTTHEQTCH